MHAFQTAQAPSWKKLALTAAVLLGAAEASGPVDTLLRASTVPVPCADEQQAQAVWQPEVGASWQIVLYGGVDMQSPSDIVPDVDIFDLDVFDNDQELFEMLQGAGKRVICYFSAGSWEDWRDDKDEFEEADMGNTLSGWPDERWLDIRRTNVRNIISRRIEVAASKGCDAIDPDNVDGYSNDNGLGLTRQDTIDYVRFLAEEAHSHNMAMGLKNAAEVIGEVLDVVEFSVNEQCVEWEECETFAAFIDDGKPVFHIEYPEGTPGEVSDEDFAKICGTTDEAAGSEGFSKLIKEMDVLGWVLYCDGSEYETPLAQ